MRALVGIVDYVNLALFTLVALVAIRQWLAGRGRAGLWAALSFGALAVVVDVGRLVPDDPTNDFEEVARRVLVGVLVLFPYLLYKFTTAFGHPTRRLERFVGAMTVVVLVWTFVLPEFPAEGEPRPASFVVYLVAFLVHWTVLTVVVAVRLWRAGRGQPSVARRRMQMLSFAALVITVALLLAASARDRGSALEFAVALLVTVSAVAFLLGLAPPALLRLAWRRPEQRQLQQAIGELMTATTEAEVVERVLAPMARMVGARAVSLEDENGGVVGAHGVTAELVAERDAAKENGSVLRLDVPGGQLTVWTTPYAPFFGRDELALLRTLAALTGLALDRTRLFAQERHARLALERADEVKTSFIALAAHELRTPVTGIHGIIETLHARRHELRDDQLAALERMLRQQSDRMRLLVEQLLDLSRLDAEAIEINPERLPIRQRLEELVAVAAGDRADSIAVEVPPDLAAVVDPNAFERIVSNLVTNALRYGAPPIRVRAEQRDRHFRLAVEDSGPGVDAEFVPQLFERFARAEGGRRREGTGLGLAIARAYARAHGGDLIYEAAMPRGARFEVVLPTNGEPRSAQA